MASPACSASLVCWDWTSPWALWVRWVTKAVTAVDTPVSTMSTRASFQLSSRVSGSSTSRATKVDRWLRNMDSQSWNSRSPPECMMLSRRPEWAPRW